MQLAHSMMIAGSGMKAQSQRLRMIAENIANADSIGSKPGEDPYRRQMIVFKSVLDREMGFEKVVVARRTHDMSDFGLKFSPGHPMADEKGYIKQSNVNGMFEMVDMKEARRAYEANLGVVEVTKAMVQKTLELLR